jgi:hypothetical protein
MELRLSLNIPVEITRGRHASWAFIQLQDVCAYTEAATFRSLEFPLV